MSHQSIAEPHTDTDNNSCSHSYLWAIHLSPSVHVFGLGSRRNRRKPTQTLPVQTLPRKAPGHVLVSKIKFWSVIPTSAFRWCAIMIRRKTPCVPNGFPSLCSNPEDVPLSWHVAAQIDVRVFGESYQTIQVRDHTFESLIGLNPPFFTESSTDFRGRRRYHMRLNGATSPQLLIASIG